MAREYFKCFHSYFEKTKSLTDAEVGRLFRALMQYSASGEAPSLAGRESIAFDFIADEIKRDQDAYAQLCRQNAQNRAQQPSTTVNDRQRDATEHNEIDKVKGIRYKDKSPDGDISLVRTDDRFEAFWASYPRHEGKANAKKAFGALKVTDELLGTMLDAINRQKASEQWQNPKYIPMPTTWLHGRRWEDEPLKPQKGRLDHLKELYEQTVQEEMQ